MGRKAEEKKLKKIQWKQKKMDTKKSDRRRVEEAAKGHWRGNTMDEIYRGNEHFALENLPAIRVSDAHKVLFELPIGSSEDGPPAPRAGNTKWDADHVRMPCDRHNTLTVDGEEKSRWALIKTALSQPITSVAELEAAILAYNPKYASEWKFSALYELFEHLDASEKNSFFEETLPSLIKLALQLPELVPNALPLLKQDSSRSVSMTQQQVACLLANAFLCTFPRRNSTDRACEYATYPSINFASLFMKQAQHRVSDKLKCIIHYFRRISQKMPTGVITVHRRSLSADELPDWSNCPQTFSPSTLLHVQADGTIESDGDGLLQVDFANRFLGGGVLGWGCVQEEIRFVICPELLCTRLFVERMAPNEAVLMMGCERYSSYAGYADTFEFVGDYVDGTPRDTFRRRICTNVAIDAWKFRARHWQYEEQALHREANKAYVGFQHALATTAPGVATGNWGCGAYNGDKRLKALIQLIVCCVTDRPMVYFTFFDVGLCDDIHSIGQFLKENAIKIADLWRWLLEFKSYKLPSEQLYEYIIQRHRDPTTGAAAAQNINERSDDRLVTEPINSLQSLEVSNDSDGQTNECADK